MAAITWTGAAGDGNFNNPANWSPAQVPGANDTVTISPSAATLINIGTADAVETLKTSAKVTLSINDGASLTVGNAATKNAALTNAGTIELNNNNYTTSLIVGGPEVTLSGGGTILMGVGGGNLITGAAASDVLNNTGNLIEGAGQLGGGSLTYINGAGGTVDAIDGNALFLNTGANVVSNAGLLEATAGGGLVIQSSVSNGTGGHITAAGANVYLESGADISGGTLTSTGASEIALGNTATLDGTTNALTNLGTVAIQDNTTLTLLGSIVNAGQIVLENNNYLTDLVIGPGGTKPGTVTLSGSGTIALGVGPNNRIYGAIAGDTLVNMGNTIAGAGQLGVGTLSLVNEGTIDATDGNALYLNTGAATALNDALMEATGSGGLVIQSRVDSSGGGTILAANAGVVLNGGTLAGGLVSTTGTGAVYVSGSGTLDGSAQTVTNDGLINIDDSATLDLLGTITNAGTIASNANNYTTYLTVESAAVTLTGGGTILLDNSGGNQITASAAGEALVNVNNTIEGAGQLGAGTLTFTNNASGIVDATAGNALILNTGSVATANMGLLEASAGSGGLVIQSNVNNGTSGRISAAGGNVFLASSADIIGGTLSTSGTGSILDSNYATLGAIGGTITNIGTVVVQDGTTLTLLGTILNDDLFASNANNYSTDLIIGAASGTSTTTLSGGGTLSLDDSGGNRIYAEAAGDTLLNQNNTITGAGQIGVGAGSNALLLVNDGTIASATGGALTLNTGAVVTNNALIEATGGSALYIDGVIANSSGGTILSASGDVLLNGGTVQGGLVNSNAGFAVVDINNATLDGSKKTVTNKGVVSLNDGSTLTLLGTITNQGTISLNTNVYFTDVVVGAATVTLTGGGVIQLDDGTGNRIYGASGADVLANVNNTIAGAGQLGTSQLTLVNEAKGVIDADQSNSLSLTSTGGGTITNAGLIESTSTGGLIVQTTINDSTGGTILANGGNVILNTGALEGGVINTGANGGIFIDNAAFTLDGSAQTLTNNTEVSLNDGTTLTLLGTITNHGTIALNSNNYATDLIAGAATVTLTGSGTILLGDGGGNRIYGTTTADVLVNVNNLIEGAGQVGAGQLTLINEAAGIIDANASNDMTLSASGTVTNAGLIEVTGSGGLSIETIVDSSSGGTILAAGGNVYLNGGTLAGGVLMSTGGGAFIGNGNETLDGSAHTLTNDAVVDLNDGGTMTLLGNIVNNGTIALNQGNYYTDLIAGSPTVTLTGTGTIQLNGGSGARIYGASASDTLVNVNMLIEGGGQIGAGQLTLVNEAAGIIDANSATGLVLSASGTVVNAGLIEATGSGGLSIETIVDSSSGGTILAAGGNVYLNGGTLAGGLLESSGGGAFIGNGLETLDGSAHILTNDAVVDLNDNGTMTLLGTIANNGTIAINSNNYYTDLIIGAPTVTLTGTGTIQLNGGGGARIYGASAAYVLDNAGNTIEGVGQLGNGQLTLINAGVIDANGGGALVVNLGSTGMNAATGTMLAAGSGGLVFENGTYTNLGLFEATDGSALSFQSSATLTNDSSSGTLTGGTYTAIDSGHGATISITGSAVTTLNAAIVLSGANSTVEFGGTAIDTSLSTIGTAGALSVLNDRYFQVTANGGTLTDNGTITLSSSTFADTELIIGTHGVFSGNGTLAGAVSNSGTIDAIGGTLVFEGPVSGKGTITSGMGGIVVLAGGGTLSEPISGSGTLELTGGSFTVAGSNITIANLDVETDTSLSGTGTVTSQIVDTGTITANGGTLSLTGPVSGDGTLSADAKSVLIVGGGSMFGGTIAGPGTVDLIGPTTLLAGIDLTAAAINQSSTVTLASGVSVTNLAGDTYTLTSKAKDEATPHRAEIQIDGGGGSMFTNAGTLAVDSAALIAVAFDNTGKVTDKKGTLTVSGTLTGTGGISLAAKADLALTGGATYAGAFTGAGTLSLASAVTLNSGASLGVANVIDTNVLTLGSGESIKIGGGNVFALADAKGNDPHRAEVGVQGGSGSSFSNAGTVTASALADSFNLKFTNSGLAEANAGTLSFLGAVSNTGTFDATGGATISMAKMVTGTGVMEIDTASTVTLLGGAAAGQNVDFLTSSGALDLAAPLSFAGTIDGFGGSDVIDLLKTASTSETFASGVLTVQDNGATVASLHFAGSYTTADFMLSSDNNGGTNITYV